MITKLTPSPGLPDSKIINELIDKSELRKHLDLNFMGCLDEFRKRVAQEVRHINELFPEYTPHDEFYHLRRLFHIGDEVLGYDLISRLNCTELFILSISLYGHDWGMAVSSSEREYIRTGNPTTDQIDFYVPITNEKHKFNSFILENRLDINKLTLTDWQEYIRMTHAERSAERIRKYFYKIDSGVGEAVARVCEAHWLDFDDLTFDKYPPNYTVLNETINLKSIAIYLRLIDLLDISQDRTPYIIWKYVTPQNLRSKMEWGKHRSIQSVSCPPYQNGRIVQVDGSTNDYTVYAALTDLKNWCTDQLSNCNDLLAQLNDEKYNLNIYNLNWRIHPIGFKPISIQFEFDRVRMFEILSQEIYRGDKYVFLRELLQNSIDAINLRKKVLKKNGVILQSQGMIYIKVIKKDSENILIEFKDDGIGMDEHIIKNYLGVAGKSFYSSVEYDRLGVSMDPISKFGVGVLSCFMVADVIEIETTREPYATNNSQKLLIQIPSVDKQFRIEQRPANSEKIGTIFKIHVENSKLKNEKRGKAIKTLNVTDYLIRLTGLVNIPIAIEENGRVIVLVSSEEMKRDLSEDLKDSEVIVFNSSYPIKDVFYPQSIKHALELFEEERIDLRNDLEIANCEGFIIFLKPKNNFLKLKNKGHSWPATDYVIMQGIDEKHGERLQFYRAWNRRPEDDEGDYGQSVRMSLQHHIYLDGILLPGAPYPKRFDIDRRQNLESNGLSRIYIDETFCEPFITASFNKSILSNIDLSRQGLVKEDENWEDVIWTPLLKYLKEKYLNEIFKLPLKERLFQIAQFVIFRNVSPGDIIKLVPISEWPIIKICNKGVLKFCEWRDYLDKDVYITPEEYSFLDKLVFAEYDEMKISRKKIDNWKGGEFIFSSTQERSREIGSAQIKLISHLSSFAINETHVFRGWRFLKSLWKDGPPLIQAHFVPQLNERIDLPSSIKDKDFRNAVFSKAITNHLDLNSNEIIFIHELIKGESQIKYSSIQFGYFGAPFADKFAYGFNMLNLAHPTTAFIIKCYCSLEKAKINNTLSEDIRGSLFDMLKDLPVFDYQSSYMPVSLNEFNDSLRHLYNELCVEHRLFKFDSNFKLNQDSFVPSTIVELSEGNFSYFYVSENSRYNSVYDTKNFSTPL